MLLAPCRATGVEREIARAVVGRQAGATAEHAEGVAATTAALNGPASPLKHRLVGADDVGGRGAGGEEEVPSAFMDRILGLEFGVQLGHAIQQVRIGSADGGNATAGLITVLAAVIVVRPGGPDADIHEK